MGTRKVYKELDATGRLALYQELLRLSSNNKLRKGAFPQVSHLFEVSRSTVKLIWRKRLNCATQAETVSAIRSNKRNNCGKKAWVDKRIRSAVMSPIISKDIYSYRYPEVHFIWCSTARNIE